MASLPLKKAHFPTPPCATSLKFCIPRLSHITNTRLKIFPYDLTLRQYHNTSVTDDRRTNRQTDGRQPPQRIRLLSLQLNGRPKKIETKLLGRTQPPPATRSFVGRTDPHITLPLKCSLTCGSQLYTSVTVAQICRAIKTSHTSSNVTESGSQVRRRVVIKVMIGGRLKRSVRANASNRTN